MVNEQNEQSEGVNSTSNAQDETDPTAGQPATASNPEDAASSEAVSEVAQEQSETSPENLSENAGGEGRFQSTNDAAEKSSSES